MAGTGWWVLNRQPEASGPSVVAVADAVALRSEPSERGGESTIRGLLSQGTTLQAVAQTADARGTRWLKVWHQDSLRWIAANPSQINALDSEQLPYETYSLRPLASEQAADSSATEPTGSESEETAQTLPPQQDPPPQAPRREPETRQTPPPTRREPAPPPRTNPPPQREEPVAQEPTCTSDDIARQTTLAIQVQTETDPDTRARLQRELAEIQNRCR